MLLTGEKSHRVGAPEVNCLDLPTGEVRYYRHRPMFEHGPAHGAGYDQGICDTVTCESDNFWHDDDIKSEYKFSVRYYCGVRCRESRLSWVEKAGHWSYNRMQNRISCPLLLIGHCCNYLYGCINRENVFKAACQLDMTEMKFIANFFSFVFFFFFPKRIFLPFFFLKKQM